ncbi:MAG: biopolymer transporter ExbD [Pseudomonadota bacterium]|nr:biopolymer transporter ExbD [Pseudomonadota bacterium]
MQLVEPRPSRPMPIRMTPLIDVVFILLVFFMLTSRLLPVGHLELANATPDRQAADGQPLPELTVLNDGRIRWQDRTLASEALVAELVRAGITEVNVGTRPDTGLGHFTQTLGQLDAAAIQSHWKRDSGTTP